MFYMFLVSVLITSIIVFTIATIINQHREKQKQLFNKQIEVEEKEFLNRVNQEIRSLLEKEVWFETPIPPKTG